MALISGLEHIVREGEPLARHTWFRLGGPAEYFAEPTTVDELATLVTRCRQEDVPVRLLGGGSNILASDQGVRGVVVHLAAPAFVQISVEGNSVKAGGGARLSHVVASAVREGLAGLEQLVAIPGTLGGALHGNSGRQHAYIGQWTESATVMTRSGEILVRQRNDLQFAYRQSSLNELVVLDATLQLESENPQDVTKRMQKLWIVAKANQPMSEQSSGRIFKNPHGIRAAELVEQVGLKGARIGEAVVSDRNENYIVAGPRATAQDVRQLIDVLHDQISQKLGIDLEYEINIW